MWEYLINITTWLTTGGYPVIPVIMRLIYIHELLGKIFSLILRVGPEAVAMYLRITCWMLSKIYWEYDNGKASVSWTHIGSFRILLLRFLYLGCQSAYTILEQMLLGEIPGTDSLGVHRSDSIYEELKANSRHEKPAFKNL